MKIEWTKCVPNKTFHNQWNANIDSTLIREQGLNEFMSYYKGRFVGASFSLETAKRRIVMAHQLETKESA